MIQITNTIKFCKVPKSTFINKEKQTNGFTFRAILSLNIFSIENINSMHPVYENEFVIWPISNFRIMHVINRNEFYLAESILKGEHSSIFLGVGETNDIVFREQIGEEIHKLVMKILGKLVSIKTEEEKKELLLSYKSKRNFVKLQ